MAAREPNLNLLIAAELGRYGLVWLFWVALLASALAVIVVTQDTRMKIAEREELFEQRDELNNEWRHLIIEQNALAEHDRIEQLAHEQLQMQRPKGKQEIIVRMP